MDKQQYIELINRQIDGELKPGEIKKLEAVLSSDPDARKTYQELTSIASRLGRIEMVDPPENLLGNIRQRIDPDLYRPKSTGNLPIWQELAEFLLPRRNIAMAFVTGLILGIICIFMFVDHSNVQDIDILGTVGNGGKIETQSIVDQDGIIEGVYSVKKADGFYFITFDLDCSETCIATLSYPQKDLLLSGYQSDTPGSVTFHPDPSRLKMILTGDASFTMRFDAQDAEQYFVLMEIGTAQKMLIKKKIILN